jgi:hypothetical protein
MAASTRMSHVSPALYRTLAQIVPDLYVHCVDTWCLIGSTAALLAGAEVGVTDVDVLVSRGDAERLITQWASMREEAHEPADAERFRSLFARFRFPGMPVEIMGGLELNGVPVSTGRLTLVGVDGLAVPVPSVADQIRIFESLGRNKDRQRAAALRALASSPLRGED